MPPSRAPDRRRRHPAGPEVRARARWPASKGRSPAAQVSRSAGDCLPPRPVRRSCPVSALRPAPAPALAPRTGSGCETSDSAAARLVGGTAGVANLSSARCGRTGARGGSSSISAANGSKSRARKGSSASRASARTATSTLAAIGWLRISTSSSISARASSDASASASSVSKSSNMKMRRVPCASAIAAMRAARGRPAKLCGTPAASTDASNRRSSRSSVRFSPAPAGTRISASGVSRRRRRSGKASTVADLVTLPEPIASTVRRPSSGNTPPVSSAVSRASRGPTTTVSRWLRTEAASRRDSGESGRHSASDASGRWAGTTKT